MFRAAGQASAETLQPRSRIWGMRYSRGGIIAVLLAAELFVAGAIIWVMNGHGFMVHAAGMHRAAAQGKDFAPIDAGASPNVLIDDPNSRIDVGVSADGKVHVTDATVAEGWIWGENKRAPLQVARTGDGVAITRTGGSRLIVMFGYSDNRVEVQVPAGARLDVRRCSAAEISGLNGEVRVHSVDGHITATDVRTQNLTLASDDGRLTLNNVSAAALDASTKDGSIHADNLQTGGGTLQSGDGSITVGFAPGVNLSVHARTGDGRLTFDGRRAQRGDDDASAGDYEVGSGGGSLQVTTQDGSIHITSNGAR